MNKNEQLEVIIEGYSFDGYGVCKPGGYVLFVPGAIKGERLKVKVLKAAKNYGYAKIIDIITPSPERIAPLCSDCDKCGGCQFWHMTYTAELELKKELVNGLFERAGFGRPIDTVLSGGVIQGYRNKAQYPIRLEGEKAKIGFFAPHSHRIVECRCLIQPPQFEGLRHELMQFLTRYNIPAFNEAEYTGIARGLYLRQSADGNSVMAALIVNGSNFKYERQLVNCLTNYSENVKTVLINFNSSRSNSVLSPHFKTLLGDGSITDTLLNKRITFGAGCFYQINHAACEILYKKSSQFLGEHAFGKVLDLFCGVGSIGICTAPNAKQLIGAESVESSVNYARINAKQNGLKNASFIHTRVENASSLKEAAPDAVIVDPPRAGLHQNAIKLLMEIMPKTIVYISCNPVTLCRDLAAMSERYNIANAAAVDMFPRTSHVETVVLLSKGKIDSKKVRVEFSLEGMDMSGFQKGATYEQIKAYVLEHSELKVSSLYISQAKRKCGLDVGQNYNLSKKENAKVPKCPPEKEAAIMDALKHFGMI